MRPVKKGAAYLYVDGQPYANALEGLAARLGRYCSYCEREIKTGLEVEHIQPKSIHFGLERVWANFLLGCKNCNATKSDKNPALNEWLIPDRDNTSRAYFYREDGIIDISLPPGLQKNAAQTTLDMMGLNKEVRQTLDESGNLIALDRRTQRLEIWLMAKRYRGFWDTRQSPELEQAIVDLARSNGFFSIWMAAFNGIVEIRQRLIAEFPGTEHRCFDAVTTVPTTHHPNDDLLPDGGKL